MTVTVEADEPITAPTVTCNGMTFALTGSTSGLSTTYTATRVIAAGDADGELVCTVTDFTDAAGNDGTAAEETSNEDCTVTIG